VGSQFIRRSKLKDTGGKDLSRMSEGKE